MGLYLAGFDIIGIDINPQPNYPFEFFQLDMKTLTAYHIEQFDMIWASPPCQLFSIASNLRNAQGSKSSELNLIPLTRSLLNSFKGPFIIENVPGAPLKNPIQLCGSAFNLSVRRHRIFESNIPLQGTNCFHKRQGTPVGVYHTMNDSIPFGGTTAKTLIEGQYAMGISWMNWKELTQAIPPAYSEYLGLQVLEQMP